MMYDMDDGLVLSPTTSRIVDQMMYDIDETSQDQTQNTIIDQMMYDISDTEESHKEVGDMCVHEFWSTAQAVRDRLPHLAEGPRLPTSIGISPFPMLCDRAFL